MKYTMYTMGKKKNVTRFITHLLYCSLSLLFSDVSVDIVAVICLKFLINYVTFNFFFIPLMLYCFCSAPAIHIMQIVLTHQ